MSYGKILMKHMAALATYDTIGKRLREQKTVIEAQEAANEYPHYMEHVVAEIGKMICRRLGKEYDFEVLGPFGLCNESGLHVYKKITPKYRRFFCGLTFVGGRDGGAILRDTRGGIANSKNRPPIEIPPDANAAWFLKMAGKRI